MREGEEERNGKKRERRRGEEGRLTRRDHEVIDLTRSLVKNNAELTNFGKLTRIEWHNGK